MVGRLNSRATEPDDPRKLKIHWAWGSLFLHSSVFPGNLPCAMSVPGAGNSAGSKQPNPRLDRVSIRVRRQVATAVCEMCSVRGGDEP